MKCLIFLFCLLFQPLCASINGGDLNDIPLVAGDKVSVSVINALGDVELTVEGKPVTNQGSILLPRLGLINTKNSSILQFKSAIKEAVEKRMKLRSAEVLVDVIKNIRVSYVVKEIFYGTYTLPYGTNMGTFLQQVRQPSIVDEESYTEVLVQRGMSEYSLNMLQGQASGNFVLEHGDVVRIKDRRLDENHYIYLVGNFNSPGRFYMSERISLMDVFGKSLGSGLTEPKFTRKIYIFRRTGEGQKRVVIEVDARQLLKMGDLTQNVNLKGGDVILASVERKIHFINRFRAILDKYTNLNDLWEKAENARLFH